MSINMHLSTVYLQTETAEKTCRKHITNMRLVRATLVELINEESLQGKGFSSIKTYFSEVYLPLIDGIELLCEAIIKANKTFPVHYVREVDTNSLESDILEEQLVMLQNVITSLDSFNSSILLRGSITQRLLDINLEAKARIREKLNKLLNFNLTSVSIFSEIDEFLTSVQIGLRQISGGAAWDSKNQVFDTTKINLDWSKKINDKKAIKDLNGIIGKLPRIPQTGWQRLHGLSQENGLVKVPKPLVRHLDSLSKENDIVRTDFERWTVKEKNNREYPRDVYHLKDFEHSFNNLAQNLLYKF